MGYKVLWSREAEESYFHTIDELLATWPQKIADDFIDRTESVIEKIENLPYLFRAYKHNPSIRYGILHKNITMFYKVDDQQKTIRIMLFWATKRNPDELRLG